ESQKQLEDKLAQQEAWIEELQNRPAPEAEKVEVAVIPNEVSETLAELAARAEALADAAEEKLAS
ncbi:MAG: cell division protein ZapA, partial [Paracoccaceae bacterium]